MPRELPSRISTRQSRRHSLIPSSSKRTMRRAELQPLHGPDGTPLHGILADSDPELKNLTKSEAQKRVNQSIRKTVIKITGGPPDVRVQRLCKKNHTMQELQPMVGHNDYTNIGRYYSMCAIGTGCTFKTYGERLPEENLMLHDVLTPLLFKREELRSIPMSNKGKEKEDTRVTIASSPLYADAIKKYYAQFSRNSEPLTPPPTNHRGQPMPFPCPSPLNRPSAAINFIDLSEDHDDVLFCAVVWVDNNAVYKTALLAPKTNEHSKFSLSSLKIEMGESGIEQSQALEIYDPLTESWCHQLWNMEVGPLHDDGHFFLFRYAGVTNLRGFDRIKTLARRLPG